MKDFDDFYSYNFTWIIHNDESSDESDFKIDLEIQSSSTKVLEEEEESKICLKMKRKNTCIIID